MDTNTSKIIPGLLQDSSSQGKKLATRLWHLSRELMRVSDFFKSLASPFHHPVCLFPALLNAAEGHIITKATTTFHAPWLMQVARARIRQAPRSKIPWRRQRLGCPPLSLSALGLGLCTQTTEVKIADASFLVFLLEQLPRGRSLEKWELPQF